MRIRLRVICWITFAAVILSPSAASAACAPGATSFCQKLPDSTNKNSAIFLGIVKQVVMPKRTLPPLPSGNQPSGASAQARRQVGEPLPTIEKKYPTARFQVLENYLGAGLGEFEVRMTSDHFIGDIPQQTPAFAYGELWLVEAYLDQHDQQWTTSYCQRTKPAAQAEEDLRVLRAWVTGQRLPARVTGEVWNPVERKNLARVQVHLRGGKQTLSATTDGRGQFSFDELDPGVYEAFAALPQGGIPVKVDLTQAWCSRVILTAR
jgi:hypothetical protein